MTGAILLQIVLIALNAVFASAEIAVISMNDAKLERLAKKGNKQAKRLVAQDFWRPFRLQSRWPDFWAALMPRTISQRRSYRSC